MGNILSLPWQSILRGGSVLIIQSTFLLAVWLTSNWLVQPVMKLIAKNTYHVLALLGAIMKKNRGGTRLRKRPYGWIGRIHKGK